jgi:hypothetical protein
MASRRKYKSPKGYRDGGAVTPDDVVMPPEYYSGRDAVKRVIEGANRAEELQGLPPPLTVDEIIDRNRVAPTYASPPVDSGDAVKRALAASRRAEELQRQAARPPQTLNEHIDRLPGLSDHKRRFLREHPDLVTDPFLTKALSWHWQAAQRSGIEDDSPAMDAAILRGVRGELEQRRQRDIAASNAATPMMSTPMTPPTIERTADRLGAEADMLHRAAQANAATPMALADNMPEPPPRQRSIPVSAPVSREVPSMRGQRGRPFQNITLSPEEREIARNSFSAPDMSNEEKEMLFARNKARMMAMREAGTLNE